MPGPKEQDGARRFYTEFRTISRKKPAEGFCKNLVRILQKHIFFAPDDCLDGVMIKKPPMKQKPDVKLLTKGKPGALSMPYRRKIAIRPKRSAGAFNEPKSFITFGEIPSSKIIATEEMKTTSSSTGSKEGESKRCLYTKINGILKDGRLTSLSRLKQKIQTSRTALWNLSTPSQGSLMNQGGNAIQQTIHLAIPAEKTQKNPLAIRNARVVFKKRVPFCKPFLTNQGWRAVQGASLSFVPNQKKSINEIWQSAKPMDKSKYLTPFVRIASQGRPRIERKIMSFRKTLS